MQAPDWLVPVCQEQCLPGSHAANHAFCRVERGVLPPCGSSKFFWKWDFIHCQFTYHIRGLIRTRQLGLRNFVYHVGDEKVYN